MIKHISPIFGFTLAGGLALFATSASADFTDDFNRANAADLGAQWQVIGAGSATRVLSNKAGNVASANNLSLVTAADFSAPYTATFVGVDIFSSGGTGYVALAMGHNGLTTVGNGLFIKAQINSGTQFNSIGFYTGVGVNTTTPWSDPPIFINPIATPFSSARMTVWASDATTINIGLDTDFNGSNDQTFTRHLNLGAMTFGNQVGLGIFGTNVTADNFFAIVPEPSSALLLLGSGMMLLLRRRRASAH